MKKRRNAAVRLLWPRRHRHLCLLGVPMGNASVNSGFPSSPPRKPGRGRANQEFKDLRVGTLLNLEKSRLSPDGRQDYQRRQRSDAPLVGRRCWRSRNRRSPFRRRRDRRRELASAAPVDCRRHGRWYDSHPGGTQRPAALQDFRPPGSDQLCRPGAGMAHELSPAAMTELRKSGIPARSMKPATPPGRSRETG